MLGDPPKGPGWSGDRLGGSGWDGRSFGKSDTGREVLPGVWDCSGDPSKSLGRVGSFFERFETGGEVL